jgi:hypothetical protein
MNFNQTASAILSALSATVFIAVIGADKAQALSEVSLPSNFAIENANNRNMVVDKFGDNPTVAANAHQYSKENSRTYTLKGIRSANGSYEVQLVSSPNLCFTMAGGLNPNAPNGTLAVFSNNCTNSLNLRFYDDGTVRVARNTNLCLTNQGNRYNQMFNKLHFWACDNSPETKFNFAGVGNPGVVYQPQVVTQSYNPPAQNSTPQVSNKPASNATVQNYNPNIVVPKFPAKVLPNVPLFCGPKIPWQVCGISATLKFSQYTNGLVTLSYDEMKAYLNYSQDDCPSLISLGEQVARKSGLIYQFKNIHGSTVTFGNRNLY